MKKYDYLIMHSTDLTRLYEILKSKTLYANKHISKKYMRLSEKNISSYIYTSLIFDDLKNITTSYEMNLILHPKIIYEQNMILNNGWISDPNKNSIYINTYDKKK